MLTDIDKQDPDYILALKHVFAQASVLNSTNSIAGSLLRCLSESLATAEIPEGQLIMMKDPKKEIPLTEN